MNDKILHSSELPEEFLKIFGLDYNSDLSRLEIVFEANEPAVVNAITVDTGRSSQIITQDMIKALTKFLSHERIR